MIKDNYVPNNAAATEEEFAGDFWDERWARTAEDLPARQRKVLRHPCYKWLREYVARRWAPRVLDCGCGMGEWTLQPREEGIETVGIDIATQRIEQLQKTFGASSFSRGSFLETGLPAAGIVSR